jgi:hypothetical protein
MRESTTPAPAVAPIAVATRTTRAVRAKLGAGAKYPHSGLKLPAERISSPASQTVAAFEITLCWRPQPWCCFAHNNQAKALVPRPILVGLTAPGAIGKTGLPGIPQE